MLNVTKGTRVGVQVGNEVSEGGLDEVKEDWTRVSEGELGEVKRNPFDGIGERTFPGSLPLDDASFSARCLDQHRPGRSAAKVFQNCFGCGVHGGALKCLIPMVVKCRLVG